MLCLGKSPTIVDKDVDPDVVAERLMFGKTVNVGQTCLAPDYVFVHASVKDALINSMKAAVKKFYGDSPESTKDYSRVINR